MTPRMVAYVGSQNFLNTKRSRRSQSSRSLNSPSEKKPPTTMPHELAHYANRSAISRARARWILTTAWVSEAGHADQAHVSSSA